MKGKVALVTGASRGIGRSIAQRLAEAGASVAITGRFEQELENVRRAIGSGGGEVLVCPGDLAHAETPRKIVEKVIARFDRLDFLINNAGIPGPTKHLEETTLEEWDMVMAVNARAPFLLCCECLPFLKKSGSGTIINITSVNDIIGYVKLGAYSASKHALRGMTKVLAKEVFKDNVRVHIVAPAGVDTEMLTKNRPEYKSPMLSTADEVADVVMYLLNQREQRIVIDEIRSNRYTKEPWQ